jgi:ribosomal protein S18 acetylase RimI-like enzyme
MPKTKATEPVANLDAPSELPAKQKVAKVTKSAAPKKTPKRSPTSNAEESAAEPKGKTSRPSKGSTSKSSKKGDEKGKRKSAQAKAEARTRLVAAVARSQEPDSTPREAGDEVIRVRRMHRRDINRVWEFLKLVFREVNQKTVEYQRPRSKQRFEESYDDEGIDQLVFDIAGEVVGYAESTFQTTGSDNWVNWRWFDARDMRPLFVEELAVHPNYQGCGVGSFMLEQLRHIASLRGCTHLVLEVAENNEAALAFYRKRSFQKIDASIFLAHRIERQPELLPPRPLKNPPPAAASKSSSKSTSRSGGKSR